VKLRGSLALSLVAALLVMSDLFQRLVICPLANFSRSFGPRLIGAWQRLVVSTLFSLLRWIGGARIPRPPRIPGEPGVLILMNHQSLLDIPLIVAAVDGHYPRIVTRRRYARWIPLISHTLRKLSYPLVDPGAKAGAGRRHLEDLEEMARTSEVPLALFPEGTRTRDGEVGRFRTRGLERILGARDWNVYMLVGDGFWKHAKLVHFVNGMGGIEGQLSVLGPFEWPDPDADAEPFIDRMHELMVAELERVRAATVSPELAAQAG
jgi:1-acyl-sn-glycerol-3-phosphate acyltransferase